MTSSNTTTPVKDQPHPFQPTPEVPLVYARAGATVSEIAESDGSILEQTDTSNCALCNSPRSAQIHVEGKEDADASPIHWG
jgi:hypothetical protein